MPTDWESRYREGNTPWDHGAPSPGLVDYLAEHPPEGRVLVPGCGLGHDARAIAAAGAREVVGIDIAPTAVAAAQRLPAPPQVHFAVADLFALPPAFRQSFDLVFEHTCFCAIDPELRSAYVEAVAGALKPGGHLLAVFYLNPDSGDLDSGPPFGVTPAGLDTLFSPRFETCSHQVPARAYPGREGREAIRLLRLR